MRRTNALVRSAFCLAGLLLLLPTGFASQLSPERPVYSGPRIGLIKNTDGFLDAGCDFRLPADAQAKRDIYIFLTDFADNAVMNIDGKDVKLRQISHKEPERDIKKGSRSTETYTGKGVEVRVDYVATWVCPPDDESCEVTRFNATITVSRRESKTAIKVKGLCGT